MQTAQELAPAFVQNPANLATRFTPLEQISRVGYWDSSSSEEAVRVLQERLATD